MVFFWDVWVMFIVVNMLFKCLIYFLKWMGIVFFGWRLNLGKVGRLIVIVEVVEGCEGEVVGEEFVGIENKVDW